MLPGALALPKAFAFAALNIEAAQGGRAVLKLGKLRQEAQDHPVPITLETSGVSDPSCRLSDYSLFGSKPEVLW